MIAYSTTDYLLSFKCKINAGIIVEWNQKISGFMNSAKDEMV